MIEVEELAIPSAQTKVWLSARAMEELARYAANEEQHKGAFLKKLKYWALAGFWNFEGSEGTPIKHEWDNVYRIGQSANLFRLIGFFEDDKKRCFIGIDAFLKKKQKLNASERERINEVAKIRKTSNWKKKVKDGNFPRLAQDNQ